MNAWNLLAFSPFDPWHLLIIGLVALLLFGKRLPEVGRSLGKGISEFKRGLRDVQDELNRDDEARPRARLPRAEDEPADARRFAAGEPESEKGTADEGEPEQRP